MLGIEAVVDDWPRFPRMMLRGALEGCIAASACRMLVWIALEVMASVRRFQGERALLALLDRWCAVRRSLKPRLLVDELAHTLIEGRVR